MNIGIIGFGNMGQAIYNQVSKLKGVKVWISEKDSYRLQHRTELSVIGIGESKEMDYIIVAVKPKDVESLTKLAWKGVIVSVLAGTGIDKLKKVFPDRKIVRLMPNTPLLINEGISGVYFDSLFHDDEKEKGIHFLNSFTKTVLVEKESLMDAVTAVSGSGPAYAYLFIEAMADAGVRCGLSRQDAYLLASQTLSGSAKMVMETGKHPGELKDMVTSPAGTTIEAIAALEAGGFRSSIMQAVKAAFDKAKNIS